MEPFEFSLPWRLSRDSKNAGDVLEAIALVLQSTPALNVTRLPGRLTLDWGALRMFYRAALTPIDGDSFLEWGYYLQVSTGLREVVAGRWSLNDHYSILENLAPSSWSQGALRSSMTETLKAVASIPEARLVEGIVVDPSIVQPG